MASLLSNAECGPSNGLSTFSKHSQQDRTLQQDRWGPGTARPQESFRTPELHRGPDQAAFHRDAQIFFEGGPVQPLSHDEFQRTSLPPIQPRFPEEDWNQQFQRINISSLPPGQHYSPNQLGKLPAVSGPSQWHEEFTRFQTSAPEFSYKPQVQQRLASIPYTTSIPYDRSQQMPIGNTKLEDEAFELAFAEAEDAVHSTVTMVQPEPEPTPAATVPKLTEKEEADRLAQTAGELFDRLQHERDTDEKFRNSTFMALMKKLRDREVVVSGNDMVESSSLHASSINGGDESVST